MNPFHVVPISIEPIQQHSAELSPISKALTTVFNTGSTFAEIVRIESADLTGFHFKFLFSGNSLYLGLSDGTLGLYTLEWNDKLSNHVQINKK